MNQQAYKLFLIENIESVLPLFRVIDTRKEEIFEKPEKIERIGRLKFDNELSKELHIYELPNLIEITDEDLLTEDPDEIDRGFLNEELARLIEKCNGEPKLTDDQEGSVSIVTRKNRNVAFRVAVKKLSDYRCAVCGIGLRSPRKHPEVQSAHIYPKAEQGSDDVRNGICLCRMHHWAFDVGWFSINDDYTIIVNSKLPPETCYNFIRDFKNKKISLPLNLAFAPNALYLGAHRQLMGF